MFVRYIIGSLHNSVSELIIFTVFATIQEHCAQPLLAGLNIFWLLHMRRYRWLMAVQERANFQPISFPDRVCNRISCILVFFEKLKRGRTGTAAHIEHTTSIWESSSYSSPVVFCSI